MQDRHLGLIDAGRHSRHQRGVLAEFVCEPADGTGQTVVMTIWSSHEVFDAWIATPHRDALTASEVHGAVTHRPITRFEVPGGYLEPARPHCPRPETTNKGDVMKWITRARPKTDRIASPWLIRRFIDPDAEILYVAADQVLTAASEQGGHSFDAPGAKFTHQPSSDGTRDWCTFETLIGAHDLGGDPALARLAKIVHAADVAADLDTDPLGPGLLAIGVGGLDVEADDQLLLERGMFVYDALYAWCARQVGASPA